MKPRWAFLLCAVVLLAAGLRVRGGGKPISIGMIPDAGATQVSIQEKEPLRAYLARKLDREVNLVIPTNYNATVEGLGNGSLDFAYLGGLTYVKAQRQYGVLPLVQRTTDVDFHSLFITQAGSPIHALADLKGRTFAFGDINSTSGHLMPYYELKHAGINVDTDLKYRYTGSHPATAKAVESGAMDAGALDESVYNAMIVDGKLDKTKVRILYTSKPFLDYVWVARKDITAADRERFAQAFLDLQEGRDDAVLAILRGKKFVRATDDKYALLRSIAVELKMF